MEDAVCLEDGKLVLFRRSGLWQARIHLGHSRYLWRSLKTANLEAAKRSGIRLFYETGFKLAQGLPVQLRSFNAVIDEYIAYRQRDHDQGLVAGSHRMRNRTTAAMLRQIKRVSKFWREYAGNKPIEAIDDAVLRDFVAWRRAYYHRMAVLPKNARLNPTDKTLQWEMMLGKALIRFAHDQGYRGNLPLPSVTFVPKVKRVRPAFTMPEYLKLYRSLNGWIKEQPDPARRYTRRLLRDYVLVLANSGLRVGEANALKWRDVVPFRDGRGRHNVQLHVRGKTGARVVIPRVTVVRYLERLKILRGDVGEDDWVFAMSNGDPILTLIDQFNVVIERAGMQRNSSGEKFTLYSLRHFYAVQALSADIDIYTVARNMGTSVAMIEQYYGRSATPQSRADRLGG